MSLKLSISTSRKIGEANYGSRGATVGIDMEVDAGLTDEPLMLHEQIARLFRLAKEAVDHELNRAMAGGQSPIRAATPAQIRAIYAIANGQNLDLIVELRNRFGVYRADDLSLEQASQLIDSIKPLTNGAASAH